MTVMVDWALKTHLLPSFLLPSFRPPFLPSFLPRPESECHVYLICLWHLLIFWCTDRQVLIQWLTWVVCYSRPGSFWSRVRLSGLSFTHIPVFHGESDQHWHCDWQEMTGVVRYLSASDIPAQGQNVLSPWFVFNTQPEEVGTDMIFHPCSTFLWFAGAFVDVLVVWGIFQFCFVVSLVVVLGVVIGSCMCSILRMLYFLY